MARVDDAVRGHRWARRAVGRGAAAPTPTVLARLLNFCDAAPSAAAHLCVVNTSRNTSLNTSDDVVVLVAREAVDERFTRAVRLLAAHHAVLVVFAHPVDAALLDDVRAAGAALAVVAPTSRELFRFVDEARAAHRRDADEILDALWRTRIPQRTSG